MDVNSFVIGYKKGKASVPSPETQEKEITITENGTTEVTPDDGKLLSRVIVETEVTDGYFATEENEAGGLTYEISANMVEGGGAKLNIHCSADTPPTDTSKLWVKTETEPPAVIVSSVTETADGVAGGEAQITSIGTLDVGDMKFLASASVDNKIYLFGNNTGTDYWFDTFCYDIKTGQIEEVAGYTGTSMSGENFVSVGNNIYCFGGDTKDTTLSSQYLRYISIYNTEKHKVSPSSASLPYPMAYMGSAVVGDKIYLFGGITDSGALDTILCYDSATDKITTLEEKLPVACYGIGAATVGTKVYLFGGRSSSSILKTILCFDTKTENIEQLSATLPRGMYSTCTQAINNRVYLLGGLLGGYELGRATKNICCFDVDKGTVEQLTTKLPYPVAKSESAVAGVGLAIYLLSTSAKEEGSGTLVESNDMYKFEALSMLLAENAIQIYPTLEKNMFRIVNTQTVRIDIGVKSVFKGNTENVGEEVEAALYQDGEWVNI